MKNKLKRNISLLAIVAGLSACVTINIYFPAAAAEKAADKIISDARTAINIEKQAALKEVKIQVAMFSLDIAEKLMKKNLANDSAQKELVEGYIKDVKIN